MELSLAAPTVENLAAELDALGPALMTGWERRRDLAGRVLGFASEVVSPRPRTPAERFAGLAPLGRARGARLGRRVPRRRGDAPRGVFPRTRALAAKLVPASVDSHWSAWSYGSMYSIGSVYSILSGGSVLSAASFCSVLSLGSAGSVLSIGSAGSILSIGSAGSVGAIGGAGVNNLAAARDAVATPTVTKAVNLLAVGAVVAAAGASR